MDATPTTLIGPSFLGFWVTFVHEWPLGFELSGKGVALQPGSSTEKAYLCNQGGTVSFFLSRLACHILLLAEKHGITLIPAYIPAHLHVEAIYLLWGKLVPEWYLPSSHSPSSLPALGSSGGGSVGFLMYQSVSALLQSGATVTSRSFWIVYIQLT